MIVSEKNHLLVSILLSHEYCYHVKEIMPW